MLAETDRFLRLIYPETPEGIVVPDYQEVLPPEDFIRALYEDTRRWLEERGATTRREFSGQKKPRITGWDKVGIKRGGHIDLPLELEEAVILEDEVFTYALALGTRHTQQYKDKPGLSFQTGFNVWQNKPFNTRCLQELTSRRSNNLRTVGFRIIDNPLISVSGSLNAIRHGGQELRDSHEFPLRDHEGYDAATALIKRTLSPGPIISVRG